MINKAKIHSLKNIATKYIKNSSTSGKTLILVLLNLRMQERNEEKK